MSLVRISLLIWFAALGVRLTLAFGLHQYELFRPEPVKIAISLAQSGAFADPYALPTGFTAHAAPLYPALIAPFYYFFGDERAADFARIIFSIAVAAASYAFLPLVACSLRMPVSVGVLAGFAGALLPAHYWPESMGEFETAWVPLFLELSVIFFARFIAAGTPRIRLSAYAGVWCGLGALLSPSVLPVLAGLALLTLWRLGNRSWRWLAVAAGVALVTIAPWLARNYIRLGGVFLVRDNFALELYLSNNDHAVVELELNDVSPFYQREHPFSSAKIARQVLMQGELPFDMSGLIEQGSGSRTTPGDLCG